MIYLFVLLALIIGFFLGAIFIISRLRSKIGILYENGEKYLDMAEVLSIWMEYLENGNNIAESLQKKGYKKIAVYGIGYLGERLISQLKSTDIEVSYIIDRNNGYMYDNIPVVPLTKEIGLVDVIVITPTYYVYDIKRNIASVVDYDTISIESIIRK